MLQFGKQIAIFTLLATIAFIGACGSDSTNPVEPDGLTLTLSETSTWIASEVEIQAELLYPGREAPDCDWYVDGVLGGDTVSGSITQDNPATYTAPIAAPVSGEVEIMAVWSQDETVQGIETLLVNTPIVELVMEADGVQVEGEIEVDAEITFDDRTRAEFDWYVDGILGGDAASGTITQDTPAVYSAPSEIPDGGTVQVMAKWRTLPDLYFVEGNLEILFTIKHVNATLGQDEPGRGSIDSPFRTITYTLGEVTPNDTILVAPGTYGPDLGEASGNIIQNGVTLRGTDRDACILETDPENDSSVFYMFSGTIEHFTLRNQGYPESDMIWGIQLQGSATVRDVHCLDPFHNQPIRTVNAGTVGLIEDCLIDFRAYPTENQGLYISGSPQSIIRNTTIMGCMEGIYIRQDKEPVIEGCTISENYSGIFILEGANPDLGGGAGGSLGMNVIQNNVCGIKNYSDLEVYALYNTWTENPPVEGPGYPCDYYNYGESSLIWELP